MRIEEKIGVRERERRVARDDFRRRTDGRKLEKNENSASLNGLGVK